MSAGHVIHCHLSCFQFFKSSHLKISHFTNEIKFNSNPSIDQETQLNHPYVLSTEKSAQNQIQSHKSYTEQNCHHKQFCSAVKKSSSIARVERHKICCKKFQMKQESVKSFQFMFLLKISFAQWKVMVLIEMTSYDYWQKKIFFFRCCVVFRILNVCFKSVWVFSMKFVRNLFWGYSGFCRL